ncbi:hypothetical protein PGTUg99_011672 [Puccinia graminis f. sp. tritici]|uniref:Uncharacterized protein n=1 Tax=Puccinia graminis f. sp. tritici TaxID=56615 RepID=A0A5B0QTZ6_PUCGR|nr:hypothetical protein PGTUg99_011672 [Puccinia graminis f. sp. tritici]
MARGTALEQDSMSIPNRPAIVCLKLREHSQLNSCWYRHPAYKLETYKRTGCRAPPSRKRARWRLPACQMAPANFLKGTAHMIHKLFMFHVMEHAIINVGPDGKDPSMIHLGTWSFWCRGPGSLESHV